MLLRVFDMEILDKFNWLPHIVVATLSTEYIFIGVRSTANTKLVSENGRSECLGNIHLLPWVKYLAMAYATIDGALWFC